MSKLATIEDAMSRLIHDGDNVVMGGFTHLILLPAGHELIPQRRKDLTLVRPPWTAATLVSVWASAAAARRWSSPISACSGGRWR